MKTDKRLFAGIIAVLALLHSVEPGRTAPRAPQPPWPEESIKIFGFDSGYARGPWRNLALNEDNATLLESWSGYALSREASRESFLPSPVIIPARASETESNFAPAAGTIRFWFAPNWSTASKTSGGQGPGHAARLLELVQLNREKAPTRWALFFNAAGDTLSLAGETKLGAEVLLQTPVEFTAGAWRMITLCYSETNVVLQLDTETIAKGAGLVAPAAWEEQNLGLVIGSDVYASADSLAEGQFEEVVTKRRWPTKMDWQEMYFKSGKRRSLLGAQGTKQEEQAKVVALKSTGLLPEEYGVTTQSLLEEGGGTMAYNYAEGSLWLEILSVTNGQANLTVHGTEPEAAYEILSKEALTNSTWAGELPIVIGADGQDWTPTTVAIGARTNSLFLWARVLRDTDGDGLPDWWELEHGLDPNNPDTGNTGVSDGYKDSDNDGWTNLQEYQNGTSPGLFNTPAVPSGFAVHLAATGTNVHSSWLTTAGPAVSYTIEREYYSTTIQVTNATSALWALTDDLPEIYSEGQIPRYRIQAHYPGGSSAWSPWQRIEELNPPQSTIRTVADNVTRLFLRDLPPYVTSVRVGNADIDWEILEHVSVFDEEIALAQFTNGVAILPEPLVQTLATTGRFNYVRFVLTNGVVSAIDISNNGYAIGRPFWDGRAQLKDNLRFLFRVATPTNSFGFNRHNGASETTTSMPVDYAYASYLSVSSYTVPQAVAQKSLPFEDNYDYRNLIFDPDYLDGNGALATGMYWAPSFLGVIDPRAFKFQPQSGVSNIASLLTPAETTWTAWCDHHPTLAYLTNHNVGVSMNLSVDLIPVYSMAAGARNLYGLPYLSFVVANDDGLSLLAPGTPNDSASGYAYPQTAQPIFQTTDYYFARQYGAWYDHLDAPKLPGHPTFSPTNTSPLLIASIGDPDFRVAGYAKLAVTNGYPGVYGFLGQYFDQAFTTTNGVVTTNETGLLSPYGEFFPTEPGRMALVTLPDLETGQRGTATVYVVSMNLDANHDGIMDRSFFGPDQTTAAKPFRFWINNDRDPYSEDLQYGTMDFEDGKITSMRDLEDFARLWISGLPALPASNGYSVTLSWRNATGSPKIKIYPAAEEDGGAGYLTNSVTAQFQLSVLLGQSSPGQTLGEVTLAQPLEFPPNYFAQFGRKHFLFEGSGMGRGELVLTIRQSTDTIVETSVFFELLDIKQMYERWTIGEVGSMQPVNTPYLATDGLPVGAAPFQYPHNAASDTNTPYILHVHGWNMTTWSKNSYAETGFKRLYWQGYTGRYGAFRWPTYFNFPGLGFDAQAFDLNNYEKSEWQAWKSATGLRTLLTNLNTKYPNQVRVTGHSMGNVVVGEALRISSSAPKLAAVYAALQAAIPSHCYDAGATNRSIPFVLNNNTPNAYANYWQSGSSNYFHGFQGASNYVNFFNTNDFALERWEFGQNLKPASSLTYSYDQIGGKFYKGVGELTFPANTHEIFSFCTEPRCYALGAQPNVGGYFNPTNQVDLNLSPYDFGEEIPGHSGQFRFSNQACWPFWKKLLESLNL